MTSASPKDSRLDLRMTEEQKGLIARAAEVQGLSLSQWSIDRLVTAAREDIASAGSLVVDAASFEKLLARLDAPRDARFDAFMAEKTVWDR